MAQFFYKQKFNTGRKMEDGSPEIGEAEMSLNEELVLFTILLEDGRMKIIFNDWHEESKEVPVEVKNAKGNIRVEMQNRKVASTSDVILSQEDGKRFKKVTKCYENEGLDVCFDHTLSPDKKEESKNMKPFLGNKLPRSNSEVEKNKELMTEAPTHKKEVEEYMDRELK